MYRYNRRNNLFMNAHNRFNDVSKRNYTFTSIEHKSLQHIVSDNTTFRQQNLSKANHINALDKIRREQNSQRMSQIGNLNKLRDNHKTTNTVLNPNSLPKPRSYDDIKGNTENNNQSKQTKVLNDPKDIAKLLNKINQQEINEFKQYDPLAKKQTKIMDNEQDIKNLLTVINQPNSNNQIENIQTIKKQTEQQSNIKQQNIDQYQYVISSQELLNKAQFIAENIQLQIYADPQYNYYKLIQFVHRLYEQYGNNNMVLMIICKGFAQFNKKQMIKLPEDKISDIIQYIISQIKKDK